MRLGRQIVALVIATTAAPVIAQQTEATPAQVELKSQMRTFELVLHEGVNEGGQHLAAWAIQGGIVLAPGDNPVISGTPLPDGGLIFTIQIPEIYGANLFRLAQRSPAPQRTTAPPAQSDPKPAPQQLVSATAAPRCDPADPMTVDPERQYAECVRQTMMDAIVSNVAQSLSVKDGQWLTVAVNPLDPAAANPFYTNNSRKLILSIRGEDLRALQEKRITRDDAKKRIQEVRF